MAMKTRFQNKIAASDAASIVGSVAIGTSSDADSKAILDLVSTTKSFLPPRMTTTQRDAISSPTTGSVIFNSTTLKLNSYNGSSWTEVGSSGSGGINYLYKNAGNPDAETDTNGWATYADAAQNIPVDGTGGSPSSTWTRTTSNPLRDTASFLWTRSANNRQGEGVAFAFTLDRADQASVISISFDYKIVSGTFFAADGTTAPSNDGTTTVNAGMSDLEVFIYDVTNSVLVPVTGQVLTSTSTISAHFKGTFQTPSNSTSYRFILHTARSTAVAFTAQFDNFIVGPQAVAFGPAVTDTVQNTTGITFTNFGTVTAVNAALTQIGDLLKVVGSFTSGTSVGSVGSINIPYSIDYTKLGSNASINRVGDFGILQNASLIGSNLDPNAIFVDGSTASSVFIATSSGGTTYTKANGSAVGNNQPCSFSFTVPIAGWSSNTRLSSDTSTTVVSFSVNTSTTAADSSTPFLYTNVIKDTNAGYSTGTGKYTIQVSGDYTFSAIIFGGTSRAAQLYKNGAIIAQGMPCVGGSDVGLVNYTGPFVAGETMEVRPSGSTTANATSYLNQFFGNRLSGPSTIAADATVAISYTSTSSASAGTGTPIIFGTKVYDTTGAFSGGTTFTAPIPGKYDIKAQYYVNGNSNIRLYKNGSFLMQGTAGSTSTVSAISFDCPLLAGETLDIRPDATQTMANTATAAFFNVTRSGN